jgi:hypothetical protein
MRTSNRTAALVEMDGGRTFRVSDICSIGTRAASW